MLHTATLPPCFVFTNKEALALHPDMQPPLSILSKSSVIALLLQLRISPHLVWAVDNHHPHLSVLPRDRCRFQAQNFSSSLSSERLCLSLRQKLSPAAMLAGDHTWPLPMAQGLLLRPAHCPASSFLFSE